MDTSANLITLVSRFSYNDSLYPWSITLMGQAITHIFTYSLYFKSRLSEINEKKSDI